MLVPVALSVVACSASDVEDDGVVLRTVREHTEVITIAIDDGLVQTTLRDGIGEVRAEVSQDADGETVATLDGAPLASAGFDLLELEALHDTLHEIGFGLPEAGTIAAPAAKADGASDAVVPGYYWAVPATATLLVDTCRGNTDPLSHEFTGETLDYQPVAEVSEVTATSYTVKHVLALEDGTLVLNSEGEPHNIDVYHCTRAGRTFASCEMVELVNVEQFPFITYTTSYLARWDRPGGGWQKQLHHMTFDCDGSGEHAAFCDFYAQYAGYKQVPCTSLSRDSQTRPTTLPVIDVP